MKKNRKNLIMQLISLCILCVGFVLCRYVFFDVHSMREIPLYLFICGLIVIGVSFLVKARLVSLITSLAYTISFMVGVIFQTDGFDPGGGRTNNLWIIWTVAFVCFVATSVVMEWIMGLRKKNE